MKLSMSIKKQFKIQGSNWLFSFPDESQLEFFRCHKFVKVSNFFHLSHTEFPTSRNSEGEVTGARVRDWRRPRSQRGSRGKEPHWLSFISKCHTAKKLASTTYIPTLTTTSVINLTYHPTVSVHLMEADLASVLRLTRKS